MNLKVNIKNKGNKILSFVIETYEITFLDMFLFCPFSLRDLKKSFDLKSESKGFFPHGLNDHQYISMLGKHLPPQKWFEPAMMKDSDKGAFKEWYLTNMKSPYCVLQSLISYCEWDTILLFENAITFANKVLELSHEIHKERQCKKRLRGNGVKYQMNAGMIRDKLSALQKAFDNTRAKRQREGLPVTAEPLVATISDLTDITFDACNLHPFSRANFTLSSMAYNFFKMYCLPDSFSLPNLVTDIPTPVTIRSSKLEIQYLLYIRDTICPDLVFAYGLSQQALFVVNGVKYYVDGWSSRCKTVYEFLGCHWHGCRKCFRNQAEVSCNGTTHMDNRYIWSLRKKALLSHPDIERVKSMWECDWKKLLIDEESVKSKVKDQDLSKALVPMSVREAYRYVIHDCYHENSFSNAFFFIFTYRGGLCGPSSLFFDVNQLAARQTAVQIKEKEDELQRPLTKEEKESLKASPDDFEAVCIDLNSSYSSRLIDPKYGAAACDNECIKIPAAAPKMLFSPTTEDACTEACFEMHKCDPNSCQFLCKLQKFQSMGKTAPEHPRNDDGQKKNHDCSENDCVFICLFEGRQNRACGRVDEHECFNGVNCAATCLSHHHPTDYGNAPGIITCTILPPQHLRYPVLRISTQTASGEVRQVSTLCTMCAQQKPALGSSIGCNHTQQQRQLVGTWMLSEVSVAIKFYGYVLIRTHQLLYYPCYQVNLFRPLLQPLAKHKILSSGFPQECMSEQDKEAYVSKVSLQTGFDGLKVEDFKKDMAFRTICKLLLCSVVGKTGQNSMVSSRKIIYTEDELRALQNDSSISIKWYKVLTEHCVLVFYEQKDYLVASWASGNVLIAADVAAFGRMDLIQVVNCLDYHGYTSVYCDTDSSIVLKLSPSASKLEEVVHINPFRIGAWKVEVRNIKTYVGTAPKSYMIQYEDCETGESKVTYKIKGFSFINSLLKNSPYPNAMKSLLFDVLEQSNANKEAWTRQASDGMKVFQARLRIDPATLLPTHTKTFKRFRICGPQSVTDTQNFVQFPPLVADSIMPSSQPACIKEPKHVNDKQLHLSCFQKVDDDAVHEVENDPWNHVQVKPSDTCGIIPCLPWGFKSYLLEKPFAFERFSYKNNDE